MSDDPRVLARAVLAVADDVERQGYRAHGILRRAAQYLATQAPTPDGACPICGGVVEQPDTGRRRSYCSARCRERARARAPRNSRESEG